MEVIIHRGTHQIGGCATEYRTKTTRIFIDFGAELDSENAKPFDIEGVTKGKTNCDAVFFTHYHGDHMGLLDTINEDIPLYMGEASKTISQILNDRLSKAPNIDSYDPERINSIKTFEAAKAIIIGDIKITPYMVDHSAYDAYMFKIEADGKSVLHTGDFRTHGFRGKGVKPTLEKYVKKVDVLVCEGTTLNRTEAKCETENDLKLLLLRKYDEAIDKDIKLGFTTIGPHRDDIKITANNIDLRVFGSQGQQRTASLSLKLAELEVFKDNIGEYPVLLLDDVLSELDSNRQNQLLEFIRPIQTLLTCTDFDFNIPHTKYHIQDGHVVGETITN